MGCSTSRNIKIKNLDVYNGGILHKALDADIHLRYIEDSDLKFVITDIRTISVKNRRSWSLLKDSLLISETETNTIVAVRDSYDNAYCVNYRGLWKSSIAIMYCLRLEYHVDKLLSDFSNIHNSRIYNACKCALMQGMRSSNIRLVRIDGSLQVKYGFNTSDGSTNKELILMSNDEIAACHVEGKTNIIVKYIDTYKINIVRFILNKVSRHEYDDNRIYEGVNLSSIKRAI